MHDTTPSKNAAAGFANAKPDSRWRNSLKWLTPLGLALVVVALITPLCVIAAQLFLPGSDGWQHLVQTVLPAYIFNTAALLILVTIGVVVLGTTCAWLVTHYQFPGRDSLQWLLVLPLAMPAYVIAYAYTDFLQYAGPLQSTLRAWFNLADGSAPLLPDVRSLGGAAIMFILVLYPYVYMLTRVSFSEQSPSYRDAGASLGLTPTQIFSRILFPLARPAIAAGTALVLMEALADYGTVSYFGVPTFTTGIYRAWFSLGDPVSSAKLAMVLLGFVIVVLFCERLARGRARYGQSTGTVRVPYTLNGARRWAATLTCTLPILLGFIVPTVILLRLMMANAESSTIWDSRLLTFAGNSILLASITAVLAVAIATFVAYVARAAKQYTSIQQKSAQKGLKQRLKATFQRGQPITPLSQRKHGNRAFTPLLIRLVSRVAGLGYAIPGAVIAVGIMVPVIALDHFIANTWYRLSGATIGLLLTGSIAALIYAYLIRFLAVSLQTIEAGLAKITPSMDDAAQSLGLTAPQTLVRVHAPLLSRSLLTAGLLVFVDVMKELPATLVMRPFNFDTLAVQSFQFASDERLGQAAVASLLIVAVGIAPILILSRRIAAARI
jgi:iron(III) transport system permease protein